MRSFFIVSLVCVFAFQSQLLAQVEKPRTIPKFLVGPPSPNWDGSALRNMAEHPEQWEECRKHVDAILYADHVLHRQFQNDDSGLTELLRKFDKMNLPFQLEVGAVKPWGHTGAIAFEKQYRQWERFLKCGMKIEGIAMDEPLNCSVDHLKKDMEYAATETVEFISLVHKNYPDWNVGDIEGFPSLKADDVIKWIDLLQVKLKEKGERGLDFFRLDIDWMHFVHNTGRGTWADVRRIETACRQRGIPFSLVYWAADYPSLLKKNMADDKTWYIGVMQMGYDYVAVGGKPDQYVVQSWVAGPSTILPESEPFSFIRSALDIADRIMNNKSETIIE